METAPEIREFGSLAFRVVDASVVSRQVSQLEHAGLITRRPDPADKRVSLLCATAEGELALSRVERQRVAKVRGLHTCGHRFSSSRLAAATSRSAMAEYVS